MGSKTLCFHKENPHSGPKPYLFIGMATLPRPYLFIGMEGDVLKTALHSGLCLFAAPALHSTRRLVGVAAGNAARGREAAGARRGE